MDRRKVYHVLQETMEYYEFSRTHGWKSISTHTGEDWRGGTFDYYELRHNQDRRKDGLYGPHIVG